MFCLRRPANNLRRRRRWLTNNPDEASIGNSMHTKSNGDSIGCVKRGDNFMFRIVCMALILGNLFVSATFAQGWARKMFKIADHDFGAVAKNSKAEFVFEFDNPYAADLHIVSVRASCGCTTPRILKETVTTYETSGILAVYNTDTFSGSRSATITVTFDRPKLAEVQLTVKGYIRNDVDISPGVIAFDTVDQGQQLEKHARVRYRGIHDWKLMEIRGDNDYFDFRLKFVGDGHSYDVVARLKSSAPVGHFNQPLTLVTNDARSPYLPLHVEGRIIPPITVSPAVLYLGVVQPNQKVSKKLVIRGKKPFRIVDVNPNDERFAFQVSDQPKKLHIVPLTFTAGDRTAKVLETIEVFLF